VVGLTAVVPVLVPATASAGHVTWLSWAAGRPGGSFFDAQGLVLGAG
jgi:hypothetical protein